MSPSKRKQRNFNGLLKKAATHTKTNPQKEKRKLKDPFLCFTLFPCFSLLHYSKLATFFFFFLNLIKSISPLRRVFPFVWPVGMAWWERINAWLQTATDVCKVMVKDWSVNKTDFSLSFLLQSIKRSVLLFFFQV